MELVNMTLGWVAQEITQAAQKAMLKLLEDNIDEWKDIARDVINRGIEWGKSLLEPLKEKIIGITQNLNKEDHTLLKMSTSVMEIVNMVLRWVKQEITQNAQKTMLKWLEGQIDEWKDIAQDVIDRGTEWGKSQLEPLKEKIIDRLKEKTKQVHLDGGTKCFGKAAWKTVVLVVAKEEVVKKTAVTVIIEVFKWATRQAGKQATKQTFKGAIKMGANPVGIVADVAQAGLEMTGNKEVGKAVGATGNVASAAAIGFTTGGPVGAAVGAAAGLAFWGAGEMLFYKWS